MKPTQQELGKFVQNEVITCQSSLVDMLLEKEIFSFEDVTNLYSNDDENMQDIFEWWIVSDWLLKQLEKQGEPVLKTDYQNYWGRTCTGQAILLDSVIEKIYIDLHK